MITWMAVVTADDGTWDDDPVFEDTRDAVLELAHHQWPDRRDDVVVYECRPR